ncbi:lyso-ornithine lipid acyltransferase [Faunimonas pinastri]|uniref:Lyso-ornithine lipid acyltransferase n=1 Tax=Faunimonas pinastri TaxID=1855383 RepID=A0A1H9PR00_9HYPH|nr:lysophospholipid acyltransferase family protein [Faunimonas pinastri]SER50617.1 lyso-ornithine lipid acyltransferase [Faunimonas pinastri]
MIGTLRLVFTTILIVVWILVLIPFHLIGVKIGGRAAGMFTPLWHRLVIRLLGIRVNVVGRPADARPLLLLSNHTSWLDIIVLASVAPVSFIAKKEVASWPVFSWLAKLQRSIFVDRERRQATGESASEVAKRLEAGDIIVLFAEGTSSDGNRVLPFRSALVGAAQQAISTAGTATVQPVALVYTRWQGIPIGRQHRPHIAWYGGADLVPHLNRIMREGAIDVHVIFGPARRLGAGDNRKVITAEAGAWVRRVAAEVNAGRDPADLSVGPVAPDAPAGA